MQEHQLPQREHDVAAQSSQAVAVEIMHDLESSVAMRSDWKRSTALRQALGVTVSNSTNTCATFM